MAMTNDWTDFLEQLAAAKAKLRDFSSTSEAPWEPWETDSSDIPTYSVVFVPRRPDKTAKPVQKGGGSKSDE